MNPKRIMRRTLSPDASSAEHLTWRAWVLRQLALECAATADRAFGRLAANMEELERT